ncbi:hypothetical protein DITRI_Ditri15bG0079300 [Diplodiscus trichospermus]
MEERMRSGEHSGIVVKNRSQSGCLIVRKKGDGSGGAGSIGTRKIYKSKKEKKRPRMIVSDSGSSDELVMPPRRRIEPETIQVCNSLAVSEETEIGRKRNREERIRRSEEGFIYGNGDDLSENKRNKLDVFDFNEYDGLDQEMMRRSRFGHGGEEVGRGRPSGSMPAVARRSIEREYESGASRHIFIEKKKKKKNLYFSMNNGMSQGDHGDRNMFKKDRDGGQLHYSFLRERYMADSDKPIRVQGKNGVLKVMVNKKKVAEPLKSFDDLKVEEARSGSKIEDTSRRNMHRPTLYSETEVLEKPLSLGKKEKKKINLIRTSPTKKNKVSDCDSEDSDTSLKLRPKNMEASNSTKRVSTTDERTQVKQLLPTRIKEGKVRRGCGTEKQKLRERIRGMLQEAGWTIDYRPRRNRDYLDAVYINPAGTAYWSIIKAYDALLKQLDEEEEGKHGGDGSAFTPLSDEVLSQLTRKTRKKMLREMKKKQRDDSDSENAQEAVARKSSSTRREDESMDSLSHEEKLSSFIKQGKSFKCRINNNGALSANAKGQSSLHVHDSFGKPSSISNSYLVRGRKSRKLGRCTLMVRGSNVGLSSEGDDFIPFSGKRTVLSWLIDSGVVQLSQKVQYMNRRRTKVMLEGWITRDGIHCGCCSKILTVSKFEIHAGSKLRQPFQNIYLDSGVSLLQSQIDAWNRQEESEQIGFHSVGVDGDDPDDDTCGICGDGGDLICCDSCPSTFHQSCLNIELLPVGDWHCLNCVCKFCGNGSGIAQKDDITDCGLLTCSLCEKKYHKPCIKVTDEVQIDSSSLLLPFCGKTCRELFEHLQKYLGVKHELEAGFSWSFVRRTDADSDTIVRGRPQRVECNSKLAVALAVMDECFLPIIDRRSGINLINNVLYNCGSNFNRLNYSGFYTAILERGDEIISAASIRFHGTQLAEMPFIGTRHIYRRQGMCRRLFCAIESAFRSLKVEKLVIPAIAELTHTWTAVFGFTPLEESIRQEMRSMNMLVFPGVDMLQKLLPKQENTKAKLTASAGAKETESGSNEHISPEVADESKPGSSSGHDTQECNDGVLHHSSRINGETTAAHSGSQCPNVSSNDTCGTSGSLDASEEPNTSVSVEETTHTSYRTGDKRKESASDSKFDVNPSSSNDILEMGNKAGVDSPAENNSPSCTEGTDDTCAAGVIESKVPISDARTDLRSGDKAAESASDSECLATLSMYHSAVNLGNKTVSDSPIQKNTKSCEEGDLDIADAGDNVVAAASDVETETTVEETICTNSQSGDKLGEYPDGKSFPVTDESHDTTQEQMKKKIMLDSPEEDNSQPSEEHPVSIADSRLRDKLAEYASPEKSFITSGA